MGVGLALHISPANDRRASSACACQFRRTLHAADFPGASLSLRLHFTCRFRRADGPEWAQAKGECPYFRNTRVGGPRAFSKRSLGRKYRACVAWGLHFVVMVVAYAGTSAWRPAVVPPRPRSARGAFITFLNIFRPTHV